VLASSDFSRRRRLLFGQRNLGVLLPLGRTIGPMLLDPAHVAGDLADDFIVALVPLEFDHK
jgi:hypothetical protein